jgi:hypothetical protein
MRKSLLSVACTIAFALFAAWVAPVRAQEPQPGSPWRQRFEHARAALVDERFIAAAAEFEALTKSAQNDQEQRTANELAELAWLGEEKRLATLQPKQRTTDELGVLYTTAALYGIGTAGMLTLQFEPSTLGGAILPFAVFVPASIGCIALLDNYKPFAHGVPQALAAGLYLGFGEALWLVGYQHAYADLHPKHAPWHSNRVSAALWGGATLGGIVGGLIGALGSPTPGRSSFTASSGLWTGVLSAFAASALESRKGHRSQSAYLVGDIAYNAGLLAGIALGPSIAPSVARVRFVDLGGLGGALLGGGGYALLAHSTDSRGSLAAAAVGGVLGLGLTWWATSGMPADQSHDELRRAGGHKPAAAISLHPTLAPTRGGFIAGVLGQL